MRVERVGPSDVEEIHDEISGSSLDPAQPLIWRRAMPLSSDFELLQGTAVFGEMEPAAMVGTDATGECLGRSLELSLESTLLRGIRVKSRVSLQDQEGPGFAGRFFGWGRITTPSGERLRWRRGIVRTYDHILVDGAGAEVLRLRPAFLRFARTETRVLVRPGGWMRPDLPELILLTWFLRVHSDGRGRRVFRRGWQEGESAGAYASREETH